MKELRFDPTWNYVPRTALLYVLPLGLLSVCVQQGWIGMSRDFWVPFLWGLIIHFVNTRYSMGRSWAIKDFQNRDIYPPTLAVLHGATWCICANIVPSVPIAMACFFLFWMTYDALMIHYEILCVYRLDLQVHKGGTFKTLSHFGFSWWAYVSSGLALAHLFGENNLASIGTCSLLMIVPMQLMIHLWNRPAAPERFKNIRKIAVVGAGWSGLYTVKWLSQYGLDVTCYEANNCIGGIWKYREETPGGVFKNTRVTSSKHFLHASDFPIEAPTDFPYHSEILDYLDSYVDHFDIRDHLVFNTRVLNVCKKDQGWEVKTEDASGARQVKEFDAVVVCSGPHQDPKVNFLEHPLYADYKGEVMGAGDYKHGGDVSKDETVLVVGAGETSADIVAECAQEGATVYWSSQRGQQFADRNLGPFAADHFTAIGIRVFLGRFGFFEFLVRRWIGVIINIIWGRGGHGIRGWEPHSPYLHQFVNKSRDAVLEVHRGRVRPRGAVRNIEGKSVFFDGEEKSIVVDRIILATGYESRWSFLSEAPTSLYKRVFQVEDPTLAFVGFARPILGSIPSLSELQARWLANAWSGKITLPCRKRREVITYLDRKHDSRNILDSSRLRVLVDQEVYATELASYVNANVHWLKLLLIRPRAFAAVLWSPWIAFKYRLNDSDPGLRKDALLNILREMPVDRKFTYGGNPVYLLVWEIIIATASFLLLAGLGLWYLPMSIVLAVASGSLLTVSLLWRRRVLIRREFSELKENDQLKV